MICINACSLGGQIVVPSRLMHRPDLTAVAERVGRTSAQVMLRWGVQRGASVLPSAELPWQMQASLGRDWMLLDASMLNGRRCLQGISRCMLEADR